MPSDKHSRPLPGSRTDPNLHEDNEKLLLSRDDGLEDISRIALAQLTHLLSLSVSENIQKPSQTWLDKQESKVKNLHWSLQAPANLLERLALRINRHHRLHFLPQVAQLCPSHKGLDPRVIRNLTLLVGHECTLRTDRFRSYRTRTEFPDHVHAWLDRIDSVAAMWVGKKAFQMVFGYKPAMTPIQPVESGCEACIMAVVGSRPQLLCDLRASILVRKMRYADDATDPRLLRIVDSWISHFHVQCRATVKDDSEALAKDIFSIFQEMKQRKEKRHKKGGHSDGSSHHKRRHRRRHHSSHHSEQKSAPTPPPEDHRPHRKSFNPGNDRNSLSEVPLLMEEELELPQDNSNSYETWDWLNGRMAGQGLTPSEREEVLGSIHPAFSEFKAPSALPQPLASGNAANQGKKSRYAGLSATGNNYSAQKLPPVPAIPELYRQDATLHEESSSPREDGARQRCYMLDSASDDSEEEEEEEYIPARRNWATGAPSNNPYSSRNTAATTPDPDVMPTQSPPRQYPPPPAPSSFYSEHPDSPTKDPLPPSRRSLWDTIQDSRRQTSADDDTSTIWPEYSTRR